MLCTSSDFEGPLQSMINDDWHRFGFSPIINNDCHRRRRKGLSEIGRLTRAPVVILTWNIIKHMEYYYQTNEMQFLLDLKMSQSKITLPRHLCYFSFLPFCNCNFYILPHEPLYCSYSPALFSRWENIGPVLGIFFCLFFIFIFFHMNLYCSHSVFTLGKYWSGPGNPPPWSTPKAPPLSALYYSQPAEIFQPSPRPALIGLFRALFDLRPEIQNWQVWWLVVWE